MAVNTWATWMILNSLIPVVATGSFTAGEINYNGWILPDFGGGRGFGEMLQEEQQKWELQMEIIVAKEPHPSTEVNSNTVSSG